MNEIYINVKDFNECWIGKKLENDFNKDLISVQELVGYIEDLIDEIENLQEEYNNLQKDLEDNYVSRPMSDYTGDAYDDRL